jgi:hypothetical protein
MPLASGVDPKQSVRLMKMKIRGDTREASLRVTTFDTLARKLPTVTDGVIETDLAPAPGASPNAVLRIYRLPPKVPLEPGEYMVVQYDSQMWDFGVD